MPTIARIDGLQATPTVNVFAESSSEAAALPNGQKALTPIIAGTISGTCVIVAWIVALVAALVKRHKRKKKYKKVGRLDLVDEHPKQEVFIVPPDPAVVLGQYKPGERVLVENEKNKQKHKTGAENGKGKQRADEEEDGNVQKGGGDIDGGAGTQEELNSIVQPFRKDQRPRRPEAFTRMSTIWSTNGSRQGSSDNVDRGGDSKTRMQCSPSDNAAENKANHDTFTPNNPPESDKGRTLVAEDLAYKQDPTINSGASMHLYPPS